MIDFKFDKESDEEKKENIQTKKVIKIEKTNVKIFYNIRKNLSKYLIF